MDHCIKNNVLSNKQAAYLKGDSTINQLLYLVHEIRVAWGQKDIAQTAFLDISAAFDKVWHKGLLCKEPCRSFLGKTRFPLSPLLVIELPNLDLNPDLGSLQVELKVIFWGGLWKMTPSASKFGRKNSLL